MDKEVKEKIARENILRKSEETSGVVIKGYDFDGGVDYSGIIKSFGTTGFQASHLSRAIEIVNKMIEEEAFIYLGYTSNMVSSGLRDIIAYLVRNKMVDVLVTTAGGVEEDIIKSIKPFLLGRFDADGADLREKGVNRIGNIFVPNSRYIEFEKLMNNFLKRMLQKQKQENNIFPTSEILHELGKEISDEGSILYNATKHSIPIFCPAITDGSFGDMVYFFKKENPEFKIDVTSDIVKINDTAINAVKTGVILLGSGIMKHHISNANLFREGSNYAVYINSNLEFDGSDSGAKPEEAKSWGKISPEANTVKIYGDATIIFPLLVAGAFRK